MVSSDPTRSDNAAALPFKELLVLVPALASALAVAYDVGYFFAFDINYFNFFSLSEHVVFALQALPIAVALSLIATFWMYPYLRRVRGRPAQSVGLNVTLAAMMLLSLGVFWMATHSPLTVAGGLAAGMLLLALSRGRSTPSWQIAVTIGVAALIIAGAAGLEAATAKKFSSKPSHTIRMRTLLAPLEGVLIRAGERGLLFQNAATRQVSFIPWDDVVQIATNDSAPTKRPKPWLYFFHFF